MSLDPRTPVIIGVGQHSQRVDRGEDALEPVDLMVVAARSRPRRRRRRQPTASAIDSVRTVGCCRGATSNPGALVAERLGVGHDVDSGVSAMGGNSPQMLLNETALDIAAGRASLRAARRRRGVADPHGRTGPTGDKPDWTVEPDDTEPAREIGTAVEMNHEAETSLGIFLPIQVYPMFEQARRHHLGRTMAEHLPELGALWSRFSEVAAAQPPRLDPGADDRRGDRHPDADRTAWSGSRTRRS